MKFDLGDHVHVASFGKGVVREVRNGGRYLVELKGRSMVVTGSQLTAAGERKRPSHELPEGGGGLAEKLSRGHAPTSIDLHGMTAEEAVAAVDAFLDDAILASHTEVRIIHGRSGGRLRVAVHKRLRAITSVRSFRLDETNPGVTVVVL
jgi:DNA mismatch repair protein MutS2